MTEKEKMLNGLLYNAADEELLADRNKARRLTHLYNTRLYSTNADGLAERREILGELLGAIGENCNIEPAFKCDYGYNITVGDNFFANYDCIILDVAPVNIGHNVMFGPRVCVYAASHPTDPETRLARLEFGRPVNIGDNVWIGGNAVILPGVSIGKNAVIGSGSVVSKDIPGAVVAAGNPCRALRTI